MRTDAHQTVVDELTGLSLFGGCSRHEIAMVADMTTVVDVEAGHVLCRQGEAGQTFFVVLAGAARVSVDGRDVAGLSRGCGFGEIALLRSAGRRSATVVAAGPMRLGVMSRPEFATVFAHVPAVARYLLQESSRRLAEQAGADRLGATP